MKWVMQGVTLVGAVDALERSRGKQREAVGSGGRARAFQRGRRGLSLCMRAVALGGSQHGHAAHTLPGQLPPPYCPVLVRASMYSFAEARRDIAVRMHVTQLMLSQQLTQRGQRCMPARELKCHRQGPLSPDHRALSRCTSLHSTLPAPLPVLAPSRRRKHAGVPSGKTRGSSRMLSLASPAAQGNLGSRGSGPVVIAPAPGARGSTQASCPG